ncbi:hypothetical protein V8E51_014065 [Hyaloscypha variabilis]
MHRLTLTLFVAFLLPFTLVLSAPSQSSSSLLALGPTDENTVPATFIGYYGEHEYTLNGTVEQVLAQLKELHPEVELKKREVTSRAVLNKEMPPLCIPIRGWNWVTAYMPDIQAGVVYLDNLNTRINIGPTSCSRISCSWNGAIYLCNDNPYSIQPASPYLASYAQDLINICTTGSDDHYPDYKRTGGQEFDTDGYNIIVREDGC